MYDVALHSTLPNLLSHLLQYSNIEEFTADFVLLFDNACKYNEPDSLIYKDALTLQV